MIIRNLAMVRRSLEHAKKTGARVILQQTGSGHLFGNTRKNNYKDSLCAAYRKAGAHVLPVFITSQSGDYGINVIPKAAREMLSQSVIVEGLAEEEFRSRDDPSAKKEEAFVRQIHEASGGEIALFDSATSRDESKKPAINDFKALIDRVAKGRFEPQPPL